MSDVALVWCFTCDIKCGKQRIAENIKETIQYYSYVTLHVHLVHYADNNKRSFLQGWCLLGTTKVVEFVKRKTFINSSASEVI